MLGTAVTSYQHGKYVRQAVESVLDQSLSPSWVILVDDASDDETEGVFAELVDENPNVEALIHRVRHGHISNYNLGIQHNYEKYHHLMAADDVLLDPAFYEKAVKVMEEDGSVGFVAGGLVHLSAGGKPCGKGVNPQNGTVDGKDVLRLMAEKGNMICGGCVVVRTELQKKFPYYMSLPFSADWMNWVQILADGWNMHGIPGPVYGYRQHDNQMTDRKCAPIEERHVIARELAKAMDR